MKIAVISDIHGRIECLNKVIEDINSKDVDTIVCTGDLVGYFEKPNEVIERLRKLKVMVVQGNHDKMIADAKPMSVPEYNRLSEEEKEASAKKAFTTTFIKPENREYIKNLPSSLTMTIGDKAVLFVHGSYRKNDEYSHDDEVLLAGMDADMLADKVEADLVISGHTHIPYFKRVGSRYFANAGSVGKPKHGDDRSSYIIIKIDGDKTCCEVLFVE